MRWLARDVENLAAKHWSVLDSLVFKVCIARGLELDNLRSESNCTDRDATTGTEKDRQAERYRGSKRRTDRERQRQTDRQRIDMLAGYPGDCTL